MKEKTRDIIESVKGAVGEILTEDMLPVLAKEMLKGTTLEIASSAAGLVIPGVGNVMMRYQQKRWENNMEHFASQIANEQEEINKRLSTLEEKQVEEVKNVYFPLVLDYVQTEKQEGKLPYMLTGFINIASGIDKGEDILIMYYDTLSQLSLMEMEYLGIRAIHFAHNLRFQDAKGLMEWYNIDHSQLKLMREKLSRLGLLIDKNEERMDENMKSLAAYIEDISKNKKNPKLKRLKHVSSSEMYSLSIYGTKFLKFFIERCKIQESEE